MKRLAHILSLVLAFSFVATAAMAQTVPAAVAKPIKDTEFPKPTAAEGKELLQAEGISFVPEKSAMPDVAPIVQAAKKGDAASQFIVHMMYRDDIGDIALYVDGVKGDKKLTEEERHREMIRWRDASAKAKYILANIATEPSIHYPVVPQVMADKDFQRGIDWLEKAAAHGYGHAEYLLGLVYWNGIGVKAHKKKGFALLVRAASDGVINAYYHIGMIYELGLWGNEGSEKSLYWLERAAKYGSRDAIFVLAMKYADGIGVPKDLAKSDALRKLDPTYHAWTKLPRNEFYYRYCTFYYDVTDVGKFKIEAEQYDTVTGSITEFEEVVGNDIFGEHELTALVTANSDNKEYYFSGPMYYDSNGLPNDLETVAAYSLDYKIDYPLAAIWLRSKFEIDNENVYILRAQTQHINGCRGRLRENEVEDSILYPYALPDNANDSDIENQDYTGYSSVFLRSVIALTDDKEDANVIVNWLSSMADEGSQDALLLLGRIYESSVVFYNYSDHKELFENRFGDDENREEYNRVCSYNGFTVRMARPADYAKAFVYYMKAKAWNDARRVAIQAGDKTADAGDKKAWYGKAIEASELAYREVSAAQGKEQIAAHHALLAANAANLAGDERKAIEWYEKAISLSGNDAETKAKASILLARIYANGTKDGRNLAKAAALYRQMLESNILHNTFLRSEVLDTALFLARLYEKGDESFPADRFKAMQIYQYAYEYSEARFGGVNAKRLNGKDRDAIRKMIEESPRLDLLADLEKEIFAEKGKNPDGFFIIDKVLKNCPTSTEKEDYEDEDRKFDFYYQCEDGYLKPIYEESIQKAITAITALSIAKGTATSEVIRNTFYYLAIYKGNDNSYRDRLKASSVWAKISDTVYFLSPDFGYAFHIWYLRQIPYAAKDVFKRLNAPKSWDEYMTMAQERMAQDPKLRAAYGIEPTQLVQKLNLE